MEQPDNKQEIEAIQTELGQFLVSMKKQVPSCFGGTHYKSVGNTE